MKRSATKIDEITTNVLTIAMCARSLWGEMPHNEFVKFWVLSVSGMAHDWAAQIAVVACTVGLVQAHARSETGQLDRLLMASRRQLSCIPLGCQHGC